MVRSWAIIVVATALQLCWTRTTPADEALTFRPYAVRCSSLDCDAYTFLLPEGWKTNSDVALTPRPLAPILFVYTFSDPNSMTVMRGYHDYVWRDPFRTTGGRLYQPQEGTADGTFAVIRHRPTSATQFLKEWILPTYRPRLQPTSFRETEMPEVEKLMQQQNRSEQTHIVCRVATVRLEYPDPDNGQPVEEDFVCSFQFPPQAPLDNGVSYWFSQASSYRAAKGQLDAVKPLVATVLASRRTNAHFWLGATIYDQQVMAGLTQQVQAHNEQVMAQAREAAAANAEISADRKSAFESRMREKDQATQSVLKYISDVDGYRDPYSGGEVQTPAGYKRAFVSNDGRVVVTNDAGYEPPKDPKTEWQAMEKLKQ